jgi:hypothetical protein
MYPQTLHLYRVMDFFPFVVFLGVAGGVRATDFTVAGFFATVGFPAVTFPDSGSFRVEALACFGPEVFNAAAFFFVVETFFGAGTGFAMILTLTFRFIARSGATDIHHSVDRFLYIADGTVFTDIQVPGVRVTGTINHEMIRYVFP